MISALVVAHQSESHLPRCLESLGNARDELEARGESLEVVVADSGSTDGSVAVARQYADARDSAVARREDFVHLLELEGNPGFGAANNAAARLARGDRLLLLNPDAWLAPGALPALVAALAADPRLGLVTPRLCSPSGEPQFDWAPPMGILGEGLQLLRRRLGPSRFTVEVWPRWMQRMGIAGWRTAACALLRRQAFDEIGGFDPEFRLYFEDVDLCVRLRRAGWRLGRAGGALAYHLGGGSRPEPSSQERDEGRSRLEGDRVELEYRRSHLRYYRLHRPRWERALLRAHLRRKYSRRADGSALARDVLAAIERDGRREGPVETG